MAEQEGSAAFGNQAGPDRSASGLAYQRYSVDASATGQQLGHGLRTTPSADALFSNPPTPGRNLSGGQFGSGGNAKANLAEPEEAGEET